MKVREVITYKEYFDDFFKKQPQKVRDKIIRVLDIIEQIDRIPTTYLKYIEGTNGLFDKWLSEKDTKNTTRRNKKSRTAYDRLL